MKIVGPENYRLSIHERGYGITCSKGTDRFSGIAISDAPKLYVVSSKGMPVYVGHSISPMRVRFRSGWNAKGKNGYHGYAWRKLFTEVDLDIWAHQNAVKRAKLDIETVEAEVVFLIRQSGQWPLHQTEIHFHPSTEIHREVAQQIFSHFRPA